MTNRERLIELMQKWGNANTDSFPFESVADYLIKNGVVVPPCPIGTKIYVLVTDPEFAFIKESKLTRYNFERVLGNFGKDIFLTREEAEKALAERQTP